MKNGGVILILDSQENIINQYEGFLHARRCLLKQAFTKDEFIQLSSLIVPDLLVINETVVDMDGVKVAELMLRQFPSISVILLKESVPSLPHTNEQILYEAYPLDGRSFTNTVTNALKTKDDLTLRVNKQIDLKAKIKSYVAEFNEVEFTLVSSAKFYGADVVELESDFFGSLGQGKFQFTFIKDGDYVAKKQYKNYGTVQGANSDFQRRLKNYYTKNRGNTK